MRTVRVGDLDFTYGGAALEIHRGEEFVCALPLGNVLVFARL